MEAFLPAVEHVRRCLSSRWAVVAFFAFTLLIGLCIARDYGISWDEKAMYVLGEEAYEYALYSKPYPVHTGIRFHGAWFEVLQYAVQEVLGLRFARHIFIMRHMMNYLTFWIALLAIYGIAWKTFRSRGWALIVALMFFLSPRQFGHAFFNGRDIPAMAFFVVKMFTLLLFVDRPSVRTAVLHGVASGMVIAIRVGLLFLPLYTFLFMGFKMVLDSATEGRAVVRRYSVLLGVYIATFAVAIVAFWPLLWEHPLGSLVEALKNMLWEQQAPGGFYLGENIGYLPWHWIPVHIISKTPLVYVALGLAAIILLAWSAVRRPVSLLREHRNTLLFFLWFILPIITVMGLGASLFDEWRHLYFIYPALLLLAAVALRALFDACPRLQHRWGIALRGGLAAILAVSFLRTGVWMVQNHPLQYVYFSIPSRWVEGNFELDYWGLSFRQGLEWILEHDPSDPVSVMVTSSPGWEALNILTQEQRHRILIRRTFDTKYILDNFRWRQYKHDIPDQFKLHSIRVSDMEILAVYLNPDWSPAADAKQKRMEDFEIQMRFNPERAGLWEQ
jgi:hypothetical protein